MDERSWVPRYSNQELPGPDKRMAERSQDEDDRHVHHDEQIGGHRSVHTTALDTATRLDCRANTTFSPRSERYQKPKHPQRESIVSKDLALLRLALTLMSDTISLCMGEGLNECKDSNLGNMTSNEILCGKR